MVEALEFSRPSVFTNGMALLYILAMPKVSPKYYRLLFSFPVNIGGKQVMIKHDKVAKETYAVVSYCLSIGNTNVCPEKSLLKMDENGCIPKLLKGGTSIMRLPKKQRSSHRTGRGRNHVPVQLQRDIGPGLRTHNLAGTYMVQFNNETISIEGKAYSSSNLMVTAAILRAIGYSPSLHFVNDFNVENFKRLSEKSEKVSFLVEALVALTIAVALYTVWRKLILIKGIPVVRDCVLDLETQE